MRILVVTNSARGEAIVDALVRSPQKPEIIAASTVKTPGLVTMCKEVHVVDILSLSKIVDIARQGKIDLAIVAPDDPIGAGMVDRLESAGVPCVAPKKALARIESSKSFARELMKKYGIDASPKFRIFSSSSVERIKQMEADIRDYIEHELHGNYVVKYDALKGGKGVKVSGEHLPTAATGVKYALDCIQQCGSVVIEEKLIGVEFSLMSFVSGATVVDMPAVQDHKRAFAGDTGPNTGGMGTYTDSNHSMPFLTPNDMAQASEINKKIADALMKECGEPYKGILYGGFIAVEGGVKVIEYNARFGDPEALNVLPLLTSDFVAICKAITDGTLRPDMVQFDTKATVCKYITPKSYPDKKDEKGKQVMVPEEIPPDVRVFFGDVTQSDDGKLLLGGSRSVGIVGIGDSIDKAEQAAEAFCASVIGPVRYRPDIGTVELIQRKMEMLARLRKER